MITSDSLGFYPNVDEGVSNEGFQDETFQSDVAYESLDGSTSINSFESSFSTPNVEDVATSTIDNMSSFGNSEIGDEMLSGSIVSFRRSLLHTDSDELLKPLDESQTTNLIHRVDDPLGIYTIKNTYGYIGLPEEVSYCHLTLPEDFTANDIQGICNSICDTLNWPHLPVNVTDSVPNAEYHPGLFTHATFDDSLYLNPKYAHDCINHIGSTDIVISDMAHEIGHSMATNICGNMGTYMNEKMADFISGFVCGKCGIDIDAARKWFEWHDDPVGKGGYPVSEERWDAQAAGYYFSHLANADDLQRALKDPNFLDIVKAYQHDRLELVNEMAWQQTPYTHTSVFEQITDYGKTFLEKVCDLNKQYHFMPLVIRWLGRMHAPI